MEEKETVEIFETIFERIKAETGIKSLRQLAEIMKKSHTAILAGKSKNQFPANWAYILGQKYNLSTDWIMTGKGPKRTGETEERKYKIFDRLEEWLDEMDGTKKEKEIWFKHQLQISIPSYKEWEIEKEEETTKNYKVG